MKLLNKENLKELVRIFDRKNMEIVEDAMGKYSVKKLNSDYVTSVSDNTPVRRLKDFECERMALVAKALLMQDRVHVEMLTRKVNGETEFLFVTNDGVDDLAVYIPVIDSEVLSVNTIKIGVFLLERLDECENDESDRKNILYAMSNGFYEIDTNRDLRISGTPLDEKVMEANNILNSISEYIDDDFISFAEENGHLTRAELRGFTYFKKLCNGTSREQTERFTKLIRQLDHDFTTCRIEKDELDINKVMLRFLDGTNSYTQNFISMEMSGVVFSILQAGDSVALLLKIANNDRYEYKLIHVIEYGRLTDVGEYIFNGIYGGRIMASTWLSSDDGVKNSKVASEDILSKLDIVFDKLRWFKRQDIRESFKVSSTIEEGIKLFTKFVQCESAMKYRRIFANLLVDLDKAGIPVEDILINLNKRGNNEIKNMIKNIFDIIEDN